MEAFRLRRGSYRPAALCLSLPKLKSSFRDISQPYYVEDRIRMVLDYHKFLIIDGAL